MACHTAVDLEPEGSRVGKVSNNSGSMGVVSIGGDGLEVSGYYLEILRPTPMSPFKFCLAPAQLDEFERCSA
jgi:hypothetical protein